MSQPTSSRETTPADASLGDQTPLEIDVLEFSAWRDAGRPHVVLDVREPWECEICAFRDSLDIPMGDVPQRLGELSGQLSDAAPLVVVCHHGMRSRQVTHWLRAQGIRQATNLTGGIDAWARIVDRSMSLY